MTMFLKITKGIVNLIKFPNDYIVTGQTSDEDPRSDKIVLGQIMIYLKYLGPGQFTILGPTGVTNVPNDQWKTAQNY